MKVMMVQGCTSSAGKSYLVAAICRVLANRGVKVAPFKAQNMSNNAGVTADGKEMGRAQIVQAAAARVQPDVRMNPVLIKPETDTRSQVVLLGAADRRLSEVAWHDRRPLLWDAIRSSLHSLLDEFEVVVIEGAGSPAEVNLRRSDIANMAVALAARDHAGDCPVMLVSDIDRGGSFAHLLGTYECLAADEQALVRGFVLNRFRGDAELLHPAPAWLRERTGVPVVGVVPMLDVPLPEEDGVAFEAAGDDAGASIGVIALPRASNIDEFAPFGKVMRVVRHAHELEGVAGVIIPGSKSTLADLEWLRVTGLAGAIGRLAARGVPTLGICGGMQMLGGTITDAHGHDGGGLGAVAGLGLLDITTEMTPQKVLRDATFRDARGATLRGYEIHLGRSAGAAEEILWCGEQPVGWRSGNVTGVYVHGLFENPEWMMRFARQCGIATLAGVDDLDVRLDQIATAVDRTVDLAAFGL
jgi:adenosylcobyric acid synthase